jgi:hypothetical protein
VLLILILAPIALAAGFLDAMGRQPRMAVVGAAVVTESVYRHVIAPSVKSSAAVMDDIFG